MANLLSSSIWNTAVFSGNLNLLQGEVSLDIESLLLHCRKLRTKRNHLHTIADPFLFVKNDTLFLFVEEKRSYQKGKIACYYTHDLKTWKKEGIVLETAFHLSYPFIFEHEGEVYMIPETSEANAVFLYKSHSFPQKWTQFRKLLDGQMVDSNMIYYKGFFWLFTSKGYDELHIYYSSDLSKEFQPVANNPQVKDKRTGRNAGGVFNYEGEIYRVAQSCVSNYGEQLVLLKILNLSPSGYEEIEITDNFLPKEFWWNKKGQHHFSFCKFRDKYLIAIDGKSSSYLINKTTGLFFRLFT